MSTTAILPDASAIHGMFLDCLYREEEIPNPEVASESAVLVEGITGRFGLHPERLESHRDGVRANIAALPDPFFRDSGGGWSFLNLCMNKDGQQWGEHGTMQELVVLAIGLGLASYEMPREMWSVLPGGVPYVVFKR